MHSTPNIILIFVKFLFFIKMIRFFNFVNSFEVSLLSLTTSTTRSTTTSNLLRQHHHHQQQQQQQQHSRFSTRSKAFFTTKTTKLHAGESEGGGTTTTTSQKQRSSARERKSRREKKEESTIDTSSGLEWETFDFSDSPKWDQRFEDKGSNDIHLASNQEDLDEIAKREEIQDIELQKKFEQQHKLWDNLDLELVQKATDVIVPFLMPERWDRIQDIMSKRTKQSRFLFENPANPSNVFACLRTIDSFGIQHVDVVIQSGRFKGKAALSQKRGMRTAMGSAKWLTLKNHLNTRSALQQIKMDGYHILCTDVNPSSKDIRDVDWDKSGKPICIVMGNEQYGISPEVKDMADESFYLPMVGMAESFNLSVATAITCAHLSAASSHHNTNTNNNNDDDINQQQQTDDDDGGGGGDGDDAVVGNNKKEGPLRAGDLPEAEYKTLLLKGALNSIDNRTAKALLRKHGIEFPKELNLT